MNDGTECGHDLGIVSRVDIARLAAAAARTNLSAGATRLAALLLQVAWIANATPTAERAQLAALVHETLGVVDRTPDAVAERRFLEAAARYLRCAERTSERGVGSNDEDGDIVDSER